ncbi:MAG: hypothetical protein AB8F65_02615 [Woeseiaceae bacterium]
MTLSTGTPESSAVTSLHRQFDAKLRPSQDRRNNYDVADDINVSSMPEVRDAVRTLFLGTYPQAAFDRIWLAFHDFERLFTGRFPGFHGCDTTYHDVQHTLDMTLAVARLLAGYESTATEALRLGPARAELAIIISLFHDAGYIRHAENDAEVRNGAEFTRVHVSRSAEFLRDYLMRIGLGDQIEIASQLVHFTGYEIDLRRLQVANPKDIRSGCIIGTGDLLAQMADRCYLEKCRDRLYEEFVIGGVATQTNSEGKTKMMYASGEDLLRKTPEFFQSGARKRLDQEFDRTYRFIEPLFDGKNPYIEAINRNIRYLQCVIDTNNWAGLRRDPPVYVGEEDSSESMRVMVAEIRESFGDEDSSQQVA